MHADEHCIAELIGAQHAVVEIYKFIAVTHHDDMEIPPKRGADPSCGIQRKVLFALAGVGAHGTRVFTAVAGIHDDCAKSFGARTMTIFTAAARRGGCRTR